MDLSRNSHRNFHIIGRQFLVGWSLVLGFFSESLRKALRSPELVIDNYY
jgi:hypothetical protein